METRAIFLSFPNLPSLPTNLFPNTEPEIVLTQSTPTAPTPMHPPGGPSAHKGKGVDRSRAPPQDSTSNEAVRLPSMTTLVQELPLNQRPPFQPSEDVTRGPINATDDAWFNRANPNSWKHCPANIPELWKYWWYRPVCGAAQSRNRYEIASAKWWDIHSPLPYEEVGDYQGRWNHMSEPKPPYDVLAPVLALFHQLYEPWKPVYGNMLAGSITAEFSDTTTEEMKELIQMGVKWTHTYYYFPQHSPDSCKLEYLKIVADDFGQRDQPTRKFASEWDAENPRLYAPGRISHQRWSTNEDEIVRAFDSYELTSIAMVEELQFRPCIACLDRIKKFRDEVHAQRILISQIPGYQPAPGGVGTAESNQPTPYHTFSSSSDQPAVESRYSEEESTSSQSSRSASPNPPPGRSGPSKTRDQQRAHGPSHGSSAHLQGQATIPASSRALSSKPVNPSRAPASFRGNAPAPERRQ